MRLTDPTFLFGFLPVVLGAYFLTVGLVRRPGVEPSRNAARANWVLAAASVYLVVVVAGRVGWVMVILALLTHAVVRSMDRARGSGHPGAIPEGLITCAATGYLVVLGTFRYVAPDTLAPSAVETSWARVVPHVFAPFALLFFTCHAISLVVDVYRQTSGAPRRAVDTLLYLLCFPFMAAGPIVRYRDIDTQLSRRTVGMAAFSFGARRFAVGVGKTMLIAGPLAAPASAAFSLDPGRLGLVDAWLGAVCFGLQIYFTLSGYSDMALGLGRVLGLRLAENFGWPYAAATVHAFWQRWYMSLTGWLTSYASLPLGRIDDRSRRAWRDLSLLFVLIGLWHGAAWSTLRWAAFHASALGMERLGLGDWIASRPRVVRHAYVVVVLLVGWVILRVETGARTVAYLAAMVGLGQAPVTLAPVAIDLDLATGVALAAGIVGSAPLLPSLGRWVVTVDAMATSGLMLVATVFIFVWRTIIRAAALLVRRTRGPGL